MPIAVGRAAGAVLTGLGPDVGRSLGFDQALQGVLQDGAQHINAGSSQ
jgi:hypothetical protein